VLRVVGSDPGTSSLDLLLLDDGTVVDQARLLPSQLRDDREILARLLGRWAPIDLVAAPSGYGLPLVRGDAFTDDHLEQMSLVRRDERGRDSGVIGFRAWVRAFVGSGTPLVFLPGGLHLPTIPAHRKVGAVDVGTADKVAVAALALWFDGSETGGFDRSTFAVVEIGSAFSAILVVDQGRLVDTAAGTHGPLGLRSGGGWDGEVAYWRGPLSKDDLFRGGFADLGPLGPAAWSESLIKHLAGLKAVTPFERIYLSGRGLEQPEIARLAVEALARFGQLIPLSCLAGAWVKHAAQGSAILADALAGGRSAPLAESLRLASASGSVWDVLAAVGPGRPQTESASRYPDDAGEGESQR
jgi:predicted butyrate kinase (DUF1464 family)